MQTITTKIQSSFNSTQMCKQCLEFQSQCKFNTNKSNWKFKNYYQVLKYFQFLTNFSKFFSNSKFNLLYAENKFRICYKSSLEKINYNLRMTKLYQNINSNINHSNKRGANQNLKLFSNSNNGNII